jgi:N-methylhydantoinase A
MPARKVKIGIDVGGTFTHAVALDAASARLIGKVMVPTTHTATEGVARGVVDSLRLLLKRHRIRAGSVVLIAHSTTQATNALLEGDVARVGVIGMGRGLEAWRARQQTNVTGIELAPGKTLTTFHRFIDTSKGLESGTVKAAVRELHGEGSEVFVVSEAFGVDRPANELLAADIIRSMGYQATAASEISKLYGLKVRTRTAIINASMLPKMLGTAEMTETSVRASGIKAPLMIMRSDGGIMDVSEMRQRPILTMLSGPAAGVTAALMYVKVSDGIFLEVGGTSTDISIIRNGRPMIRSAEVGGHRLYVRTLDIRTVGIGGGSMPRLRGRSIADVGPRSAHIAGLEYPSFSHPEDLAECRLTVLQPRGGDPSDYLAIAAGGDAKARYTFTPTEAANVLEIPRGSARGRSESVMSVARWLARELGTTPGELALEVLDRAAEKVEDVINQFIEEYKFDRSLVTLVGGGGGAETIVPHAGKRMSLEYSLADNADVISAIGVALGMIRETIERNIVNPTEADVIRIRQEALQAVLRMGASAETVEIRVEVDSRQKRLIATASGSPEMRTRELAEAALPPEELAAIAARSCGLGDGDVALAGQDDHMKVYQAETKRKKLFGLITVARRHTRVVDREGIIRLKLTDCAVVDGPLSSVSSRLPELVEEQTIYGDAGALTPDVFVLLGGRVIDLSGLVSKEQIMALVRAETESQSPQARCVALVAPK